MMTFSRALLLSLSVFQVNYSAAIEFSSYARVSRNGDSISIQSDRGNKSIDRITTKVSDIDSTLIDNHRDNNETTTSQPTKEREAKQMSDKSSNEKSTGRAIQSNYYFPLTNLLTKPVQSNSYNNEKTGRLIVYPSYSANTANSIDQTRSRYNVMPSTGQQTAQRRFQYTPDSIHKFKGSEDAQGYQYSQPPPPRDSKLNGPIVVPDSSPPKPAYLPPDMMPSAPGSHFLPTILPDETTSMNPIIIDLFAFPKHVNSSYMPTELDAIKNSINSNHRYENEPETAYTPPKNLLNFPPNSDSKYSSSDKVETKQPITSFLAPPSGDENDGSDSSIEETKPYAPPPELYNFPPNTESKYLPPKPFTKNKQTENSYLPPPSGHEDSDSSKEETPKPYAPPTNLYNFPPNIESKYLPPKPFTKTKLPVNSYLPSPSGDEEEEIETVDVPKDDTKPYAPPSDLFNFPPNVDSKYLPPKAFNGTKLPINSYLPSPSGDETEEKPKVNTISSPPEITAKSKPSEEEISAERPYPPPKGILSFPPNVESNYLPPVENKPPISSYLPPPSGEEDTKPYVPPTKLFNFPPNVNSNYLPPQANPLKIPNNSYLAPASGSESDLPPPIPYMYVPPRNLNNFPPNIQSSYLPPEMKQLMASVNSYLPPPSGSVSGFSVGSKQNFPGPMAPPPSAPSSYLPPPQAPTSYLPPQMQMQMSQPPPPTMNSAPSGPPMDMMMPPSGMDDHDHHHHHDHHDHDHHHDHTAPDFSAWQNYQPEIIYDYDPHHHHHHHVEPPPPETTTTEAPEEPRVKKYSYYYLGRKLWYIPLYFTLWFCLYVAALIIRSIGRHKVDLPNHYVARSLHDMSHQETVEKINRLTAITMQQIEDFKEKYL